MRHTIPFRFLIHVSRHTSPASSTNVSGAATRCSFRCRSRPDAIVATSNTNVAANEIQNGNVVGMRGAGW